MAPVEQHQWTALLNQTQELVQQVCLSRLSCCCACFWLERDRAGAITALDLDFGSFEPRRAAPLVSRPPFSRQGHSAQSSR
jgi:hypothetical protein